VNVNNKPLNSKARQALLQSAHSSPEAAMQAPQKRQCKHPNTGVAKRDEKPPRPAREPDRWQQMTCPRQMLAQRRACLTFPRSVLAALPLTNPASHGRLAWHKSLAWHLLACMALRQEACPTELAACLAWLIAARHGRRARPCGLTRLLAGSDMDFRIDLRSPRSLPATWTPPSTFRSHTSDGRRCLDTAGLLHRSLLDTDRHPSLDVGPAIACPPSSHRSPACMAQLRRRARDMDGLPKGLALICLPPSPRGRLLTCTDDCRPIVRRKTIMDEPCLRARLQG
jgi:hypothetical protein